MTAVTLFMADDFLNIVPPFQRYAFETHTSRFPRGVVATSEISTTEASFTQVQQSGLSLLGRDNIHVECVVKGKMLSDKRPSTTDDDRVPLCWSIRDEEEKWESRKRRFNNVGSDISLLHSFQDTTKNHSGRRRQKGLR